VFFFFYFAQVMLSNIPYWFTAMSVAGFSGGMLMSSTFPSSFLSNYYTNTHKDLKFFTKFSSLGNNFTKENSPLLSTVKRKFEYPVASVTSIGEEDCSLNLLMGHKGTADIVSLVCCSRYSGVWLFLCIYFFFFD
jgi:hypothetical protein